MNHEDDSRRPPGNETALRRNHNHSVLDIYPLTNYYFGTKAADPIEEETIADRLHRMKSNYNAHGLRTCVQAVMLVGVSEHPHLIILLMPNNIFNLPGGRSRPGESDVTCLKRKLSSKLSIIGDGNSPDWEVEECIGMWWRHGFETMLCPYLPSNAKKAKECTKLYLVKLPESQRFTVAKNHKILAIPLYEIHDNQKKYGPIISGIPQLLSKYSFRAMED